MNLSQLAVKRPIFITCVFVLTLVLGALSMRRMSVDLFPEVTFPVVVVTTVYPGASPREIETLVSKPMEDEISTISGIKHLRSVNQEGVSTIVVEFNFGIDVNEAEQQVRNHLSLVRNQLPDDVDEPIVGRVDPSAQPIMYVALSAELTPGEIYDLAEDVVIPQIQQVPQVGVVEILGGRKREIHVNVDPDKLRARKISASQVAQRLAITGKNIPVGKVDEKDKEKVFRLVAEFPDVKSVENTLLSFAGNDVPVSVKSLGTVEDALEDEKARTFINGKSGVLLLIYKQSKSNTVTVATGAKEKIAELKASLGERYPGFDLRLMQDAAYFVHENVWDVQVAILLGILLTVVVVFFFLGNFRSTIITGLALPNSLLGAFILMSWAGFSFNVMSLLGLSLAVGMLIDDAIVVRENIFRHMELGESPKVAATRGTAEVTLAVVATTFTILAVFGPIGFLQGIVGQFFKEFGLTVCFAMMISLLDALAMAPMLSAYFASSSHEHKKPFILVRPIYALVDLFNKGQDKLEHGYERFLGVVVRHPMISLLVGVAIFGASLTTLSSIPKTFLPPQDFGEFQVNMEAAPGTSLDAMYAEAIKVDERLRTHREIKNTLLTVGNKDGQANLATIYVTLIPAKQRPGMTTLRFKDMVREEFKEFPAATPKVTDINMLGDGLRAFNLDINGDDLDKLEVIANQVYDKLKIHPVLVDPEISHKPGKPEVQIVLNKKSASAYGISSDAVGLEMRTLVEGATPAQFREHGQEYDVRVRAQADKRDLNLIFDRVLVPNINGTLVPLARVAELKQTTSPVTINRENRGRYIRISGDIAPNSAGMGGLISDINKMFKSEIQLPPGVSYTFVGQAENFKEMIVNMSMALILGIIFVYLVLASLYESFITPITIMLVLPLAATGAFFALFITRQSLDIYSMIGCILLMGVATKNSILLVDYANQLMEQGLSRETALMKAGRTRLRPILMTSVAIVCGMIPVAIGISEVGKQRVSMGISIIGGVISSTLLTLFVIPAAFMYIDRFNKWVLRAFRRAVQGEVDQDIKSVAPAGSESDNGNGKNIDEIQISAE